LLGLRIPARPVSTAFVLTPRKLPCLGSITILLQADPDEDLFLKKIEASLLNKVELRGIPAITKVFMVSPKLSGLGLYRD
jgi:hypothetical protein